MSPIPLAVSRKEGDIGVALHIAAVGVASANFKGLFKTVPQNDARAFDRYFKLGQNAFGNGKGRLHNAGLLEVGLDFPAAKGWFVAQGHGHLRQAVLQLDVLPLSQPCVRGVFDPDGLDGVTGIRLQLRVEKKNPERKNASF